MNSSCSRSESAPQRSITSSGLATLSFDFDIFSTRASSGSSVPARNTRSSRQSTVSGWWYLPPSSR